jgi:hypothetical protein
MTEEVKERFFLSLKKKLEERYHKLTLKKSKKIIDVKEEVKKIDDGNSF